MVDILAATRPDAAAMARMQSAALRQHAREHYSARQLEQLAPAEPTAASIPDAEFTDCSRQPIVAERDGTLVGWGSVHLPATVVAATFVAPEATGQGIGRAIVRKLEEIARQNGIDRLVVPSSLNAVGFYESLGYDPHGRIDAGDSDGPEIPAVELTKRL